MTEELAKYDRTWASMPAFVCETGGVAAVAGVDVASVEVASIVIGAVEVAPLVEAVWAFVIIGRISSKLRAAAISKAPLEARYTLSPIGPVYTSLPEPESDSMTRIRTIRFEASFAIWRHACRMCAQSYQPFALQRGFFCLIGWDSGVAGIAYV
jgi:hypothetical protein